MTTHKNIQKKSSITQNCQNQNTVKLRRTDNSVSAYYMVLPNRQLLHFKESIKYLDYIRCSCDSIMLIYF